MIPDVLFFEPLTAESLIEIMRFMKPQGFVAQLGGQTPINLVLGYKSRLQTSWFVPRTIDLAEDRGLFSKICRELNFEILTLPWRELWTRLFNTKSLSAIR